MLLAMQILQFNPGSMVLIPLLIIVGLPLILIMFAIRALIKKKKKAAVWFLGCTLLYVVVIYVSMWLSDGSTMARF